LGDLDVDRRMMLRWFLKNRCDVMDWIHLAQDKVHWLKLVITVMNLEGIS
jgi:hypothetical protein